MQTVQMENLSLYDMRKKGGKSTRRRASPDRVNVESLSNFAGRNHYHNERRMNSFEPARQVSEDGFRLPPISELFRTADRPTGIQTPCRGDTTRSSSPVTNSFHWDQPHHSESWKTYHDRSSSEPHCPPDCDPTVFSTQKSPSVFSTPSPYSYQPYPSSPPTPAHHRQPSWGYQGRPPTSAVHYPHAAGHVVYHPQHTSYPATALRHAYDPNTGCYPDCHPTSHCPAPSRLCMDCHSASHRSPPAPASYASSYAGTPYASEHHPGYSQGPYHSQSRSGYTWQPDVRADQHSSNKPKRRGNLPKEATDSFKDWLETHHDSPYPSEEQKQAFVRQTGLTMSQIANWFINARRRTPSLKTRRHSRSPPVRVKTRISPAPSTRSSSPI